MYQISYSTSASALAVSARDAKEALKKAQAFAEQGHEPTIKKDGLRYSLAEFERIVSSVSFGDA